MALTVLKPRILLFLSLFFGTLMTLATAQSASASLEEENFWQLIEAVRVEAGADFERRPMLLERKLFGLEPAAIQAFQKTYEANLVKANRWDLWGAAYLMNGGCSDDCFRYFRDWLISEGRPTFDMALGDPDSLASVEKREYFGLESFGYAALKAYAAKTGRELARDFQVELAEPEGEEWAESELGGLFPKLAKKYPN